VSGACWDQTGMEGELIEREDEIGAIGVVETEDAGGRADEQAGGVAGHLAGVARDGGDFFEAGGLGGLGIGGDEAEETVERADVEAAVVAPDAVDDGLAEAVVAVEDRDAVVGVEARDAAVGADPEAGVAIEENGADGRIDDALIEGELFEGFSVGGEHEDAVIERAEGEAAVGEERAAADLGASEEIVGGGGPGLEGVVFPAPESG